MSKRASIRRLRDAKLIVEKWDTVSPFPGGYAIIKPADVPGNNREDFEEYIGDSLKEDDCIRTDAPVATVYPRFGSWWFLVALYRPGPGPGDFDEEYKSFDDAADAVLEYYFGDPSKMNPPGVD